MEHLKEKIKLHTEFLKGFFVLFVIDTTAMATLFANKTYLKYNYEYGLLIFTIIVDIVIIFVIGIITIKIMRFINLLKNYD